MWTWFRVEKLAQLNDARGEKMYSNMVGGGGGGCRIGKELTVFEKSGDEVVHVRDKCLHGLYVITCSYMDISLYMSQFIAETNSVGSITTACL